MRMRGSTPWVTCHLSRSRFRRRKLSGRRTELKTIVWLRHAFCFVVTVACLSVSAIAADSARVSKTVREKLPAIRYQKYKLRNGLDVIFSEDHTVPLVSVNIWYHVGPANERPGRTGFAHLFEHMMFEGSQHVGAKMHFHYLEGAGATNINGSTNFDRTNYYETVPSNQLELALWLESDRMGYLLPTLDTEKLANQRDVVRNERRQSLENVPYGVVEEALMHELFPKGHPYYASVIGSHADIEAARFTDVREFFRQYYTPNNASLAIAGDFDSTAARKLVEKYFGTIPSGPSIPKVEVKTPPIASERRAVVTDQVELPRVYMAWLTPPIYKPGDAENDLLADILGGGKTSRLYKKLVYEKQIAQEISAENDSQSLSSFFEIEATARPGVKPEELEKAIDDELERLRREGPSEAELERAVNVRESNMVRRLESSQSVANRLNQYNHYLRDPGYLPKDLGRFREATSADLKRVANEYLLTNARVVVYGVPGNKVVDDVPKTFAEEEAKERQAAATARNVSDQVWRANPPRPAFALKFTPPVPVNFKLANGLTVLLVERHTLPTISANLLVMTGAEANPTDKPGLASFVADMLQEGTERHASLELADELEQIGTLLSATSNYDSTSVSLRTLTRNMDAAFGLLSDVAQHPAFNEKEVERRRNQRLTRLVEEHDNPEIVRTRTLDYVLYGDSAYGYTASGTEASNKAITQEDVAGFWKRAFVPSNAALVVAGDITEAQLQTLTTKYFSAWNGAVSASNSPAASQAPKRKIYIVDKPGAPQTSLVIATIGAPRSTPDYVVLEVMNTIFGGQFSSRINMNLREVHGYTYGAQSSFNFRRGAGPFSAWGAIRTNVTAPAVTELFHEVDRIRDTEVSPEELKTAKDAWALSLAGKFGTTADIAGTEGEIILYGLPFNYYGSLQDQIDGVAPADVQSVAKKYLHPESMVVIAVGDRTRIEAELKKLNLGPVEIVP